MISEGEKVVKPLWFPFHQKVNTENVERIVEGLREIHSNEWNQEEGHQFLIRKHTFFSETN